MVLPGQRQRHPPGFGQAEFLGGDVDVIVDVAVARGEMALGDIQHDVSSGYRLLQAFHGHGQSSFNNGYVSEAL